MELAGYFRGFLRKLSARWRRVLWNLEDFAKFIGEGMKVIPYRRHDPSGQPTSLYPPYAATVRRAPRKPLIVLPHTLSEITGPVYGHEDIAEHDIPPRRDMSDNVGRK